MKKIVAIIGSPKPLAQSSTYRVAEQFINDLKQSNPNIESDLIYLNKKNISSCTGCLTCQQTGACVIEDDMASIIHRMQEADLLVFGSPVHFGFVSSLFQNFVERSLIPLHTFACLGKPFVNVVTTNGSGEQEADKYLTKIGLLFGGVKLGAVLKVENDDCKVKHYHRILKKTDSVLASGKVRPKLVNRMYFSSMKAVIQKNQDFFKAEAKLWEQNHWFDKRCRDIFKELQIN